MTESRELQLKTGPYKTTFTGTEIVRKSTPDEWRNYGEILRRVDEAKQWAIGDWLCDGKRHYGDGLYEKAESVLGENNTRLRQYKSMSDTYKMFCRQNNVSYTHHETAASIKKTETTKDGKLKFSDESDMDKIQELLKKAEKNKWPVRELREHVAKYKRQQQEAIRLANEPEKYSVIYADPPWHYGNSGLEDYGHAETHYETMPTDKLCEMPVKNITCTDSVLFLWVTSPLLEDAFAVINAWGFNYKTSCVWDKVKHNFGYYFSVRHEFLLVATKGSCLPEDKELHDSVIELERSDNHSEKPEYFRELIDKLYPTGKRIELFARKTTEGWDSWGDEVK